MNDFHQMVGTGKGLHLLVAHQVGIFLWFNRMRHKSISAPIEWDTSTSLKMS